LRTSSVQRIEVTESKILNAYEFYYGEIDFKNNITSLSNKKLNKSDFVSHQGK
jgi:hypothetical protein